MFHVFFMSDSGQLESVQGISAFSAARLLYQYPGRSNVHAHYKTIRGQRWGLFMMKVALRVQRPKRSAVAFRNASRMHTHNHG